MIAHCQKHHCRFIFGYVNTDFDVSYYYTLRHTYSHSACSAIYTIPDHEHF